MPFRRGVIRGHSTVASNQSSPPGMQRAVGYKMHCSFVSPIPFNYAVQKGRRIVSERGVSATKTRQYHPESRTRVTISEAATQGYSTVAPPIARDSSNQSSPPGMQRRRPLLLQRPPPQQQRSRCINVRHADALSRAASPCSDTRVAADQNRSPAMFAIAGLRGNGIWISTKEPCSAEDHRNRDRHRNDAGSSLVLTKTPCSRYR